MAGSLSRATAGPETTLQVLAAAGRVCVGTWGQTPNRGHPLSCMQEDEQRTQSTAVLKNELSHEFKKNE